MRSRDDEAAVFRSALVPPYVRRSRSIDVVLPWLYLHGVSTNNMAAAVSALVGPQAANLSAPVVARLKKVWSEEYEAFRKHRWDKSRIVYLWADGVYSGLR
ncbi:MAG: transposase, partial [Burkholderiales bacterium]